MERKEERKTSNLFPSHGKKKRKKPHSNSSYAQIQNSRHKPGPKAECSVHSTGRRLKNIQVLSLATQMLKLNFWLAHSDFFM